MKSIRDILTGRAKYARGKEIEVQNGRATNTGGKEIQIQS